MDNTTGMIIALLIVLFIINNNTETFRSIVEVHPTKCFSCEKQLGDKNKYLSGRSKCFSCEADLLKRTPPHLVGFAQPTKCFSCEAQMRPLRL
jgi:hypothetical protein